MKHIEYEQRVSDIDGKLTLIVVMRGASHVVAQNASGGRNLYSEHIGQAAEAFDMNTQAIHKIKQRVRNRLKDLIAAQIDEEEKREGEQSIGEGKEG